MAKRGEYARFLRQAGAALGAGAALSMLLVLLVDPYRLYRLVERPGFNSVKPAPARFQEEIKLRGAGAVRANVLMLGNSRAEIGFDPEYFSARGYSAYNLAISGSGIATARSQLDSLRAAGQRPAVLLLGVEFLDFLLDPALPPAPAPARRAAHPVDAWRWQLESLFSLDALADALGTLRIQRQAEPESMTARGFNPLLEYAAFARAGGYYDIFQQRAAENARGYLRKPRGLAPAHGGGNPDVEELRAIFAGLGEDGVDVELVIYPYHAQILALFEGAGLWPAFEQWKALLAGEVAAAAIAHPRARITLWDFSGYSAYQCETIPAKGDTASSTRWYWEAGHFKPALGELVLARILARGAADGALGFPLTPATLEENRRRIALERAACASAYPQLFRDAAALVKASR
ncbi:hypothetical protein [Janthinobacterium sp.]|uniref:hypothetical protein n=1 Tax=Janthinobacterium sp. TaxID=1871054 RepID=UPI00293D2CDF|nr:hypothetical protein [Janthinobacterium sp.]